MVSPYKVGGDLKRINNKKGKIVDEKFDEKTFRFETAVKFGPLDHTISFQLQWKIKYRICQGYSWYINFFYLI